MTALPQLEADLFLNDAGLETVLIFGYGFDLPDFAAFTLLDTDEGRAGLRRYYETFADLAVRDGVGIALDTPTWRASPDWIVRQGLPATDVERLNAAGVALVAEVRDGHAGGPPILVSGTVGPRGDGYAPDALLTAEEAEAYHEPQVRALAAAGADLVDAITMTHSPEAIGIVRAARSVAVPVVIGFTVETDGRLPSGEGLGEAIEAVDAATDSAAAYFLVNCAHPDHFADVLDPDAAWTARLRGLRANASRMSHAELDEAEELDPGDPEELGGLYAGLRQRHPQLTVLGGCCGTDQAHIAAISAACR